MTDAGLVQFPTVVGGDVPVVNLDGVRRGRTGPRRADAGQHLPRQDHQVGRSGDRQAQPERQAAVAGDRRRPSLGRFGHDLHLHQLSVQGQRRNGSPTSAPAPPSNGRSASAPRATKASPNNVTQTKGAIGYVEYAYALQNKMASVDMINADGKRVAAERRGVPGGRGQRRLGQVRPLLRHSDQSAGRDHLADRRRDLHPDVQAARGHGGRGRSAQVLQLGLHQRQPSGRGRSTTCRCRRRSSLRSRRPGPTNQDVRRQAGVRRQVALTRTDSRGVRGRPDFAPGAALPTAPPEFGRRRWR